MAPLTAPQVLDAFLARAALRGEVAVAWLRVWLCASAAANILWLSGGIEDWALGDVRVRVMLGILAVGVAVSLVLVRALQRPDAPAWLHDVSAALDALITVAVVGCSVWWVRPSWFGLMRSPHAGLFPICLATSGFRLRGRAVAASAAIVVPGGVGLLVYDLTTNPGAANTSPGFIGLWAGMMVLGGLMAAAIAGRTRTLVHEGAHAMLDAERTRQRLGVYVSQEFAEQALAAERLAPGGERRAVAVLFADLRGFTRYGEQLPPERLVRELNAWLDAMITEIRAEGGVVDKFVGDAIMVVWGIPSARPDDAARAVRAALRMRDALARHNAKRAAAGLPPLRQGVGVHVGEAIAGNIGTADRMQDTVIGDVVNLASRLEGTTKELRCDAVLSDDAVAAARPHLAGDEPLHDAGDVTIPGRDAPLRVWRVG